MVTILLFFCISLHLALDHKTLLSMKYRTQTWYTTSKCGETELANQWTSPPRPHRHHHNMFTDHTPEHVKILHAIKSALNNVEFFGGENESSLWMLRPLGEGSLQISIFLSATANAALWAPSTLGEKGTNEQEVIIISFQITPFQELASFQVFPREHVENKNAYRPWEYSLT